MNIITVKKSQLIVKTLRGGREHPVSESQRRWAFAAEERGELPEGKAHEWSKRVEGDKLPKHTKDFKPVKKSDFDAYLAISPRMSAHERYGNSERLKQLAKDDDKRRAEAQRAAKEQMRNRQPQAAVSEQNKTTIGENLQYYGNLSGKRT